LGQVGPAEAAVDVLDRGEHVLPGHGLLGGVPLGQEVLGSRLAALAAGRVGDHRRELGEEDVQAFWADWARDLLVGDPLGDLLGGAPGQQFRDGTAQFEG
jgi:hypothetical protein